MSYSGSYFDWDTRTTNKNVLALWIVVVLVVLYLAGYLAYVLSRTSGMDDPRVKGLFPSAAFGERTDGRWVAGFTGGFNAQSPNFTESQAMNDNVYDEGLGANSGARYFTSNPEWAAFENRVLSSIDSVQVRTRYHTVTVGEKISILKLRASQLGLPLPSSAPPAVSEAAASGFYGKRRGGMEDHKTEPLATNLGN